MDRPIGGRHRDPGRRARRAAVAARCAGRGRRHHGAMVHRRMTGHTGVTLRRGGFMMEDSDKLRSVSIHSNVAGLAVDIGATCAFTRGDGVGNDNRIKLCAVIFMAGLAILVVQRVNLRGSSDRMTVSASGNDYPMIMEFFTILMALGAVARLGITANGLMVDDPGGQGEFGKMTINAT